MKRGASLELITTRRWRTLSYREDDELCHCEEAKADEAIALGPHKKLPRLNNNIPTQNIAVRIRQRTHNLPAVRKPHHKHTRKRILHHPIIFLHLLPPTTHFHIDILPNKFVNLFANSINRQPNFPQNKNLPKEIFDNF